MRVHLTFDIEVWCKGWNQLDASFPAAFERYVWGRSAKGEFALPRTLEILRKHRLVGVFFVEPLFSLRFGEQHLRTITSLITEAGQDVQLHLHPEWVDEIRPPLLADVSRKRQHLTHYSLEEQTALLTRGRALVEAASGRAVTAFRSGSYAANRDTYRALAATGLHIDSSLNAAFDLSGGTLGDAQGLQAPRRIDGVEVHPVTTFRDGTGRQRHLQVGACSFREVCDVLDDAHAQGRAEVVLVSHNFEMLKPGSSEPDPVVVRRFEALCAHLAAHADRFQVQPFAAASVPQAEPAPDRPPLRAGLWATGVRLAEQAVRRAAG